MPSSDLLVRREQYRTNAPHEPLRLLYLSDLHFTARSDAAAARISALAAAEAPQLILLGGDYADTPGGRRPLARLVTDLARLAPTLAVAGNHDQWLGLAAIRESITGAGAHWIEGRRHQHRTAGGLLLHIDGNVRPEPAALSQQAGQLRLLCAHRPPDLRRLHPHYDLILAGHLHGGQLVLWQRGAQLYPGRLFYRWNGLRYARGGCRMLVSRGLGDTLPLRLGCPRELLSVALG
ncbi:metallophosphoesterase [Hymenobacter jeollabukensis]|uniref:Calcineurin-like phosphoesterase domain-containing protein n=1 Tax=Hymenobacter jeollabukensis TaxID=2025313 RepID=A0A5R8WQG7_9BACT|nr:metallophosphoesterase [Hymenobacter jeollabukensis]TLM92349.1 hypothetical protein FDY95_13025 [Hymenobacter jeollabukensis]